MSHIQLNYVFLVFWSIFCRNWPKNFLLGKKTEFLKKNAKNNAESFFFLNKFEKSQILRNSFDLMELQFWSNKWNGTNINKNGFHPQNEPHTAKLSLSVILKLFRGNWLKTFSSG